MNWWDFIKIRYRHQPVCPAKEILDKTKRQPTEWEKIFANDISVSKIYQELTKLNTQRTNNPIMKWAKDMTDISAKNTSKWPIDLKKHSTSLGIRKIQIKP